MRDARANPGDIPNCICAEFQRTPNEPRKGARRSVRQSLFFVRSLSWVGAPT